MAEFVHDNVEVIKPKPSEMNRAEIYKQGGSEGFVAGFKFLAQVQYETMEEAIKAIEDPETKAFLEKCKEGFPALDEYLKEAIGVFLENWGKHDGGPGSYLVEKGVL